MIEGMFRTRDFVLLFTVIVFLVAAIGSTLVEQWWTSDRGNYADTWSEDMASSSELFLTGELVGNAESDRIERLNRMRDKIAAADVTPVELPEPESQPVTATTGPATSSDPLTSPATSIVTCASYAPYVGFWDSRDLQVEQREGAVVVERVGEQDNEVVLQLPSRTLPAALPSCIQTDVIGIANDGSLIRNDEAGLYGVFNSDTQIGYALDGLPIHGNGNVRGDACGGRIVAGQYRYELSAERDSVLTCFAAPPASL